LVNSTWSAAAAATRRVSLTPGLCSSSSDASTDGFKARECTCWLSQQTQTTALDIQISKQDGSLSLQQLSALSKLWQLQLRGYKPDALAGALAAKQGLQIQLAPGSSSREDEEEPSDDSDSTHGDVA
jgi:hypothetical protein